MKRIMTAALLLVAISTTGIAIYQSRQANELRHTLVMKMEAQVKKEAEMQDLQEKYSDCQRQAENQLATTNVLLEKFNKANDIKMPTH